MTEAPTNRSKILKVDDEIEIRPIRPADAPVIFQTVDSQREYLGKWLPFVEFTRELKDTEDFIRSVTEAPEKRSEPVFTIWYGGKFAGISGFRDTDRLNRKTELGYWLSEPFQGKGIVTRVVRRLCEYAFSDRGMNRVQICCAVGNKASQAVPRRLGFSFEGITRDGELLRGGKYTDLEVYSLLNREFSL